MRSDLHGIIEKRGEDDLVTRAIRRSDETENRTFRRPPVFKSPAQPRFALAFEVPFKRRPGHESIVWVVQVAMAENMTRGFAVLTRQIVFGGEQLAVRVTELTCLRSTFLRLLAAVTRGGSI